MNGGAIVASVLERHGVRSLFTLCGGHISPILVESEARGIRIVDTRHEASAVFAADAVARLTGVPGVAAVTAGPGATNTITAVKNAQLAQSPVVVLGGATATVLEGRGSLQDIDQVALMEPHVKWAARVRRLRHVAGTLTEAFEVARRGVPGPVFVELPVDILYDEEVVRGWYEEKGGGGGIAGRLLQWYLRWHTWRLFAGVEDPGGTNPRAVESPLPRMGEVTRASRRLGEAERPVLLVGSQALVEAGEVDELVHAVERLGIPVYLSGMARGLLGAGHRLQLRHRRTKALKEADLVILAGVPADFRLNYGRSIGRGAYVVSANRSRDDLYLNRRPDLAVCCDSGRFLRLLSQASDERDERWAGWLETLRRRNAEREEEIRETAAEETEGVNPLAFFRALEEKLPDDSVLVADGGDFVATASYILSPRRPLSWLDPGVFGTLGVGGGFALGAAVSRPGAEVWLVYGDGSAGYSLAEVDTFVRHGLPVIAVVGNDACWMQIAREQVEILGEDTGCVLRRSDYNLVGEGYGGTGIVVRSEGEIESAIGAARAAAAKGSPVVMNVHLGSTDFRKGSISM